MIDDPKGPWWCAHADRMEDIDKEVDDVECSQETVTGSGDESSIRYHDGWHDVVVRIMNGDDILFEQPQMIG